MGNPMTASLRVWRAAALVPVLAVAGWVAPVPAATITVDTIDDVGGGGVCTLRDAITAANTDTVTNGCAAGDGVDDTIDFAVTGIINLAMVLPDITDSVAVVGPGRDDLVIAGGGSGSVIKVTGAGVTISGLTLSGGNSGSFGGGLWVSSSGEAQLTNAAITNNSALDGGGIANGGTLSLTDCIVSNDTANGGTYGGGGIYNSGTLTVTNTTISDNATDHTGGGIFNYPAGSMTLTGITVSNNSSSVGGGLYANGSITLADASVSDNAASGDGGGIYVTGSVTITGGTVNGNSGGGIYAGGNVFLTDTTVSGNSASSSGSGAGITGATVALTDSTVSGNSAAFGGGINASTVTLTRSTVSGNSAGTAGGGIYAGLSVTLDNSTLSGNSSDWGGAVYQGGGTTLHSTNSTITGNSATTEGGGIWTAGAATLRNTIIAGNTAPTGDNCQHPSGSGTFTSQGYNISNDASCNLIATGDQPSTNPMIGALDANGGPTKTHVLLAGSPAIDAGDDGNCPATDQRGIARPQDGNDDGAAACDIGAVERQPNDLLITDLSTDADPVTVGQQSKIYVTVENAGPDAVNDMELTVDLPAELSYVSTAAGCPNVVQTAGHFTPCPTLVAPACSEAGGVVTCDLGTFNAGSAQTFEFTTDAEAAGTATISTNVTGTVVEADTNNNAAQTTLTIKAANTNGGGGGGGMLNPLALIALAPFWYARKRRRRD